MLIFQNCAPVAQLDRASGYEPEGREFESPRAHQSLTVRDLGRNRQRFSLHLSSCISCNNGAFPRDFHLEAQTQVPDWPRMTLEFFILVGSRYWHGRLMTGFGDPD